MTTGTGRIEGSADSGWTIRAAWSDRVAALAGQFGPWVIGWALPFALVLYLALRRGGYDVIVRSEVGIVVWGVLLLGALAGVLPARRFSRQAWIAFGLLLALCAWIALSVLWTESIDHSFDELARALVLVGVLALSLASQGREGLRRAVGGIAAAIAIVAALALLSRFEPSWFPSNEAADLIVRARLSYPLNYWNGLAALLVIGVPLLLVIALEARRMLTRALAISALPIVGLALFFTYSRGALLALALALVVFFALNPRRLVLLVPLGLGAIGSAILIELAQRRRPIADFRPEDVASFPGEVTNFPHMANEMIAATLIVAAGVGLLGTAWALAVRHGLGPRFEIDRKRVLQVALVSAIVAVAAGIAAGGPSKAADLWEEFKDPEITATGSDRLDTASGNGRYQYWGSSLDAFASEPLTGIGAGTFEFWWDREGTLSSQVRDAHSLLFETVAELGIIGLALVAGLLATILVVGVRRARDADPGRRPLYAAATAGVVAFCFAMTIDWGWELTVLPVVFLLLAAAIVVDPERESDTVERKRSARQRQPVSWIVFAVLAIPAIVALAITLISARSLLESEAAFRRADFDGALSAARTAADAQPWAAAPRIQEALALKASGDLDGAVAVASDAADDESTNWVNWLTLSRIEAAAGDQAAADSAYERARALNPRSEFFE